MNDLTRGREHRGPGHEKPPARVFVSATIVIFMLSLSAADSVGFVPCYVDETCPALSSQSLALSNLPELGPEVQESALTDSERAGSLAPVLPERIIISAIDLNLPVQNPKTRDIELLDAHLKNGPVRYVDSARLGENGNVLIFAHTSHLPVVRNQMYKAFNRVPELKPGDTITVKGGGNSFVYVVRSLRQTDTSDFINLAADGQRLTLVTCDTLTGKSARFILEADFVGVI